MIGDRSCMGFDLLKNLHLSGGSAFFLLSSQEFALKADSFTPGKKGTLQVCISLPLGVEKSTVRNAIMVRDSLSVIR